MFLILSLSAFLKNNATVRYDFSNSMVFSMAFQAAILPAVAIPVFILLNKQEIMHEHKATLGMNIGLIAVIAFAIITTYFGIIGFF